MASLTNCSRVPGHISFPLDRSIPPSGLPIKGKHRSALGELAVENVQNRTSLQSPLKSTPDQVILKNQQRGAEKQTRSKIPSPVSRRRPALEANTFAPLDTLLEERSELSDSHLLPVNIIKTHELRTDNHILSDLVPAQSTEQQIQNHFEGHFDWLISYSTPSKSSKHYGHRARSGSNSGLEAHGEVVFSCNLLSRKRPARSAEDKQGPSADVYTFIATPFRGAASSLPLSDSVSLLMDEVSMTLPSGSLRSVGLTPAAAAMLIEETQSIAAPLSTSERSSVSAEPTVATETSLGQRIEDSLVEIDNLEDELEAINAVTGSRRVHFPDKESQHPPAYGSDLAKKMKRVSIAAGQAATLRIKSSEKARPALRRTNSLIMRNGKTESIDATADSTPSGTLSRSKSTSFRPISSSFGTPVKSSKPLTIPNFELPGEAVSRRLKEQREARQAQQAEALKAYVAPPKPRSSKPLTRPDFELPGEAISRRKREEREAKLKAQEEEERKRREFKARPIMRPNLASNTLPRQTATSLARLSKAGFGNSSDNLDDMVRSKRLSASLGRASMSNLGHARGRTSLIVTSDDLSRATSVSTATSSKHSTPSAEEAAHQRLRGRDIYQRENSYTSNREREKQERESKAILAREEAAERSRSAGRQWAQKQRQRDLAHREAMKASAQQHVSGR